MPEDVTGVQAVKKEPGSSSSYILHPVTGVLRYGLPTKIKLFLTLLTVHNINKFGEELVYFPFTTTRIA
jgi:hypothetical protein